MSRIAKADVNLVLANAAKSLIAAGGKDGKVSRADAQKLVNTLSGDEKKLVSTFFKFVDHRDFRSGAQVTRKDLTRALDYAREHMVAKYDLNKNGLSRSEESKMSLTGKLAVELARNLKEVAGNLTIEDGEDFWTLVERMTVDSEVTLSASSKVDPMLARQIIAACHESSYDDVKTLPDAFEAVDQGEIVVRQLRDAAGKKWISIDFGAGDNTYGAIFAPGKTTPAVGIHDGDLYPR
jgi:hypothetical protein